MNEFMVPVALGFAGLLAIAGFFLMWRAPLAARPARQPAIDVPQVQPAAAPARRVDGESIVIDPVAMNIVNRVAPGTRQAGVLTCTGGLMVEGTIEGEVHVVGGPFVLMPGGVVAGTVTADGEAYLFGTIRARSEAELSEVDVQGAVFLTETLRAHANVTAGSIKSYEGAQVEGRIKTVKRTAA